MGVGRSCWWVWQCGAQRPVMGGAGLTGRSRGGAGQAVGVDLGLGSDEFFDFTG